jgi:hypothetical protein
VDDICKTFWEMTAWKIERRQSLRDSSLSPEFSHTIYSFLLLDLMFIILYIHLERDRFSEIKIGFALIL